MKWYKKILWPVVLVVYYISKICFEVLHFTRKCIVHFFCLCKKHSMSFGRWSVRNIFTKRFMRVLFSFVVNLVVNYFILKPFFILGWLGGMFQSGISEGFYSWKSFYLEYKKPPKIPTPLPLPTYTTGLDTPKETK